MGSLLKFVPWHTSSHNSLRYDLTFFCVLSLHGASSELRLLFHTGAAWFDREHTRAASGAVAAPPRIFQFRRPSDFDVYELEWPTASEACSGLPSQRPVAVH